MESSDVKARSLITSVALFGAGTVAGASATWLMMSAVGSDHPSPPTMDGADGGRTRTSRWCTEQLRSILADLEVRLMDTVDDLVAHFSVPARDADQTLKSSQRTSSPGGSKSQCVRSRTHSFPALPVHCLSFYRAMPRIAR